MTTQQARTTNGAARNNGATHKQNGAPHNGELARVVRAELENPAILEKVANKLFDVVAIWPFDTNPNSRKGNRAKAKAGAPNKPIRTAPAPKGQRAHAVKANAPIKGQGRPVSAAAHAAIADALGRARKAKRDDQQTAYTKALDDARRLGYLPDHTQTKTQTQTNNTGQQMGKGAPDIGAALAKGRTDAEYNVRKVSARMVGLDSERERRARVERRALPVLPAPAPEARPRPKLAAELPLARASVMALEYCKWIVAEAGRDIGFPALTVSHFLGGDALDDIKVFIGPDVFCLLNHLFQMTPLDWDVFEQCARKLGITGRGVVQWAHTVGVKFIPADASPIDMETMFCYEREFHELLNDEIRLAQLMDLETLRA